MSLKSRSSGTIWTTRSAPSNTSPGTWVRRFPAASPEKVIRGARTASGLPRLQSPKIMKVRESFSTFVVVVDVVVANLHRCILQQNKNKNKNNKQSDLLRCGIVPVREKPTPLRWLLWQRKFASLLILAGKFVQLT